MFKFAKKKEKEREFYIHLIEKIGTLELQNQFLLERIKKLEQRIERLEPTEVQKIFN
jgi:hypothetical protein